MTSLTNLSIFFESYFFLIRLNQRGQPGKDLKEDSCTHLMEAAVDNEIGPPPFLSVMVVFEGMIILYELVHHVLTVEALFE